MKVKFYLIILLILTGGMSGIVFGQTDREQNPNITRLPPLSQTIGCGLAIRYIDDALNKAYLGKSNLILIVKTKNSRNLALAQTRMKNLRNYIRFRGFTNFEVAVGFDTNASEQVELYVLGERLYSLPIKRKDKLYLTDC